MITIDIDPKYFNNVLAQLKALVPILDLEIKAHFTNNLTSCIILNAKNEKEFNSILNSVGLSNGIIKVSVDNK